MASFTVTKRKNKASTSWQYDVKHPSFKSGKKRKSGFKTKAEATNAAQQLIRNLEDGNVIDDKTFKEYYNDWLVIKNKKKVAKSHFYWYDVHPKSWTKKSNFMGCIFMGKHYKFEIKLKIVQEYLNSSLG
ncbi:Arm DNA-binding domain-containing protein, partial [Staphylococcus felis]